MDTRREFLKKASLLAGGIGIWGSLPASVQKALSINPDPGTTFENAEHIVFLMQENRSFDHCFGTLQGVRGFNDPRAITTPGNIPVWIQKNEAGKSYLPFRLNIKDTRATWMGGLPHSWTNQVDARNNGKYDQWLIAKKAGKEYRDMPLTLGYYNREDIPFYYAMADAFTVCDQHFCSSLTGTTANRSFFWSGKIRESAGKQANVLNSDTYYNKEAHWKTFPERLEETGISWKIYQNELSLPTLMDKENEAWLANFTDNNLEWFSKYNVRFHKAYYDYLVNRIAGLPEEIAHLRKEKSLATEKEKKNIEKELGRITLQLENYKKEVAIWSPANFEKLTPFEKSLHNRAFTTNVNDPFYHQTEIFTYNDNGIQRELRLPKGDILHQFRQDVQSGNLPVVSWLVAPQYFSDHPSAPWFGAWYVSEILEILTKNPEVWKKTIFILNYDENDGYFDHIPPFTAPKPNAPESGKVSAGIDTALEYVTLQEEMRRPEMKKENARESPVGLGYRVPLIIASPWTRGGWVNSEVCDITSTLRFLEMFLSKKTGKKIYEPNISEWRRVITGDLTSAFRPYHGEKIDLPGFIEKEPFVKEIYNAKFKNPPSGYKALEKDEIDKIMRDPFSALLPGQEKGVRNANALPYELFAEGKLATDRRAFEITLGVGNSVFGSRSAGSPFIVYAPGQYGRGLTPEKVASRNYAVRAGDELKDTWLLNLFGQEDYQLKVYGPNGFYRAFKGNSRDPEIEISLEYERNGTENQLSGNILISAKHKGNTRQMVIIEDRSYRQPSQNIILDGQNPSGKAVFSLKNSYNWYDIEVRIKGFSDFSKRYAGKVETGKPSKTDPLMGRIFNS